MSLLRPKQMRNDARMIFEAGVRAVDPVNAVLRHVRREDEHLLVGDRTYDLSLIDRILVVGAGKASAAMAQGLERVLEGRIASGIVQVKYGHGAPLAKVRVNEAGHPIPDGAGLEGTRRITTLLEQTGASDFILCLISGGGSALLVSPASGLTLEDKQRTTQLLLNSGASIHEINAVRKHTSCVKGGLVARMAQPSTLVTLILSDVIGDNLDSIASGPTVPDPTTFADCLRILEKYDITTRIPSAVLSHLEKGAEGKIPETPKPGDPAFQNTQTLIVGCNILAVQAAKEEAERRGYNTMILSTFIDGETRDAARLHAAVAKEITHSGNPLAKPACVISGGETTVTIRGQGKGGRNQEFVLAAALAIENMDNVVILSGGTDGTDGPTDAAGAVADGSTLHRAREKGLEAEKFLRNNDSYRFFKPLGDLLVTGPTRTNVMDLRLVLVS